MAKRPTSPKPAGAKKPAPWSLGEALDDVGFQPIGRRIVVGQAVEHPRPQPRWVEPVVDFMSRAMPRGSDGNWEHLCITSLELGCELLVRLGRATDMVGWGAMPIAERRSPNLPLRWDDVATIVIAVASQMSFLGFRAFPGTRNNPANLLRPNIRAKNGCGPAYLDPAGFAVFRSLGLIADGSWTEAAETVLWRECPEKWSIDFTLDRRFLCALDFAVATLPADVASEIGRVVTITEKGIENWLAMPERHRNGPKTREDAVKALQSWAQRYLNDVFVRRWRISAGWLSAEEAKCGLSIHDDPLAMHMGLAFAETYLPHLPFLLD